MEKEQKPATKKEWENMARASMQKAGESLEHIKSLHDYIKVLSETLEEMGIIVIVKDIGPEVAQHEFEQYQVNLLEEVNKRMQEKYKGELK